MSNAETAALVRALLHGVPEAHLATCEGRQPRVRPLSVAAVEGRCFYLASYSHWGKVAEIAANPLAELSYMDEAKRHLRITGTARIVPDAATRRRIWEAFPLMQRYFASPDDSAYTLIELRAERVRVKDTWELEYRELAPEALEDL